MCIRVVNWSGQGGTVNSGCSLFLLIGGPAAVKMFDPVAKPRQGGNIRNLYFRPDEGMGVTLVGTPINDICVSRWSRIFSTAQRGIDCMYVCMLEWGWNAHAETSYPCAKGGRIGGPFFDFRGDRRGRRGRDGRGREVVVRPVFRDIICH